MGNFMSDEERISSYRTAIGFIREAMKIQGAVKRQRRMYENNETDFGEYGSEMDALLAQAAQMDGYAQAELAAIDDKAQPVVQVGSVLHPAATWATGADRLTITGLTGTDYPLSGTIEVTGSALGNDGTYTISSISSNSLMIGGSPSFTVGSDDAIKVVWKTYP